MASNFNVSEASLDEFTPIKLLGEGGYGRVVLMKTDAVPDKSFALKSIKKNSLKPKVIQHMAEEANICCRIENKFCVEIYRVFESETYYFILMEACLGGDLWKLLDNSPCLSEELTRFITASLLQALNYLHSNGIIYRDIKPENILIAANGYIKLADFGLSKDIGIDGKTDTICGTKVYYAPELVRKLPYGFAVDYWALGTLFYEMLAGKNPFDHQSHSTVLHKVLKGFENIAFPDTFPHDARDLVLKLCSLESEDRLQYSKETGVSHIEAHQFFEGFDFDALRAGTMPSPYVPNINGPYDTSNFDY